MTGIAGVVSVFFCDKCKIKLVKVIRSDKILSMKCDTEVDSKLSKIELLKKQISIHEKRRQESWERCDTDGFVSQWSSDLSSHKLRTQLSIEEAGGKSEFDALFDLEGNLVCAKLISGTYGQCWALMEETVDGKKLKDKYKFTGKFISAFPKRKSTMEKKGYREGTIKTGATAVFRGRGTGLSGNVWVSVVRKDGGFSWDVEVVDNGLI